MRTGLPAEPVRLAHPPRIGWGKQTITDTNGRERRTNAWVRIKNLYGLYDLYDLLCLSGRAGETGALAKDRLGNWEY